MTVYKNLNPKGFVILDAPVSFAIDESEVEGIQKGQILLSTLKAAGFKGLFPFGPIEPFIYAEKRERNIKFNYKRFRFLENNSFINMLSIKDWFREQKTEDEKINSIFHPLFLESDL